MKLNPNCIRDVLLFLESEKSVITNDDGYIEIVGTWLPDISANLPQYLQEEIFYTLAFLNDGGYICASEFDADDVVEEYRVNYITFAGHEFLESIRDNNRWAKVKSGLSAVRNYSLSAIASIAEGVTTAAINAYLSNNASF